MSTQKMNISFRISAVDRFSKPMNRLHKKLEAVKKHAESLSEFESIKIDADTANYTRKMTAAKRKADAIPKVKTTNVFVLGARKYRDDMDRLAQSLRTFDEIARGMTSGGLLTMLPAIVPLIGVAAGGIMAMASSLSSAALGSVGFASVAIPAISGVIKANEELEEAQKAVDEADNAKDRAAAIENLTNIQKQYSKAQLGSVSALRKFTSFYKDFAKQFEPRILTTFNKSLGALESTLKLARPAIAGVVTAVDNLVDSFDANLKTDDMRTFFDWLGTTAGPYLEGIVKAVGNFTAGLFNMFTAFDPLAESFVDGFLRMSESFRDWSASLSENQSFQNFMAYVQEQTPTVLSLIGNIVTTLVNLGIAMGPLATKVLEMADSFFAWTSELLKNEKWVGLIIGAIPILVGLFKLLTPIIIAVRNAFGFLSPFIKKAFTWFGKLGGGIQKVFPIVTRIGTMLLRLAGGPMGIVVQAVIALAIAIASNWDTIWAKTKEIFGKIKNWISDKVAQIAATAAIVSGFVEMVTGYFSDLWLGVKEKMSDVKDGVTGAWDEVMSFLKGINLKDVGMNIIEGLAGGVVDAGKGLIESVKGVVDSAIDGAKNLLGIKSPSRVFMQIGRFTGEGMVIGMDKMNRGVGGASKRLAGAAVPSTMSTGFNGGKGVTSSRGNFESYHQGNNAGQGNDDLLREQNGLLRAILQKDQGIYLDGREVGKAIEPRVSEIQGRNARTKARFNGGGRIGFGY